MSSKYFYLLLLFSYLTYQNLYGQAKYVDSLKRLYRENMPDTAKVNIYNRIFFHYIFYRLDSAYIYSNQTYILAKKIDYPLGLSMYYNNLSIVNRLEGEYEEGMANLLLALKINEKIGHELGVGNNYVNLGLVYATQRKYQDALHYYKKGLSIKKRFRDKVGVSYCLRDMADAYLGLKDYKEAEKLLIEVINLDARPLLTFGAIKSLGILAYQKKDYKKATEYLENSIEGLKKHDVFNLPIVYTYLGRIATETQQREKALEFYQKALELATEYKNVEEIKNIYWEFYLYYEQKNDLKNALSFLKLYNTKEDSLHNHNTTEKITRIGNNYAIKKQQEKINAFEIEKKNTAEKNQMFVIFSTLTILGIFTTLVVVWNKNKNKKKFIKVLQMQKNIVEERNEEVNQQREEIIALNDSLSQKVDERTKELQFAIESLVKRNEDLAQFSYIVSHNMRAPIATILGLLSIVEDEKIASPVNQHVMLHLEKTALAFDALIKDLDNILTIRDNSNNTKEVVIWSNLWYEIEKTFQKEIQINKITINRSFKVKIVHAHRGYLQNILSNLLQNAIKFRDEQRYLEIDVMTYEENNLIYFVMQDSGIGIDLSKVDEYKIFGLYQRMHTHVEGKGLGLYLVKTQIEAMNGSISIESELNVGTKITFSLPKIT
ncbi:MAG: hypothetical protein EAZ06_10260 [Cytophagales bacterium]|nr:MAG: hypothetical protein EAZ06_10260 [Cytophagales bacterium]